MPAKLSKLHAAIGLVLAVAAVILSSADYASCQSGPETYTAPYLTVAGVMVRNNTRVEFGTAESNGTMAVRCNTDLVASCCGEGSSHGGRWVAVGQSEDVFQRTGEGWVELFDVSFTGENYRCEIDTAASTARGGPREILYVSVSSTRPGIN